MQKKYQFKKAFTLSPNRQQERAVKDPIEIVKALVTPNQNIRDY